MICTRNRAAWLGDAIRSVLAQDYPPDRYEVLVVDNDSHDATRAAVAPYLDAGPVAVSYHREPRLGVAYARNLGLARSRGEYVAYMDDDILAAPDWLAAFDATIRAHDAPVVGGRIEPVLEPSCAPPQWWHDRRVQSLFQVDHARALATECAAPIRWPLWLGTGNSVYARALLERVGGFRTDFGPRGQRRHVAEDIELNLRLERAGVPIYYAPGARVRHRVSAEQLTRRAVWRRTYWSGATAAVAAAMLQRPSGAAGVLPLAGAAVRLLTAPDPAWTLAGCSLAFGLGYLRWRWSGLAAAAARGPGERSGRACAS